MADMDQQTEAVFKSSRTEVDPVSGNEVPPGALPEEVRDDIDAKLSEGEYVVPADVLRYFGLKFFEDLRTKAKKNMEALNVGGRIGGEPVMEEPQTDMEEEDLPFDIRELQVVEAPDEPEMGMADGGLVKQGYQDGGVVTQMANPFAGSGTVVGTDEYKTYTNEAGLSMTVRFVDGKPMSYIPPGYTEQGAAAPKVDSTASQVRTDYDEGSNDDQGAPEQETDPSKMTDAELAAALGAGGRFGRNMSVGIATTLGTALTGGLLGGFAGKAARSKTDEFAASLAAEAKDRMANNPTLDPDIAKSFEDGITRVQEDSERPSIIERTTGYKGLGDMIDGGGAGQAGEGGAFGGKTFGETNLGDMLGFDDGSFSISNIGRDNGQDDGPSVGDDRSQSEARADADRAAERSGTTSARSGTGR